MKISRITFFIIVILALAGFYAYKTRTGLHVENPSVQPSNEIDTSTNNKADLQVKNLDISQKNDNSSASSGSSKMALSPPAERCLITGTCFDDRIFLITEGADGNFIDSDNNSIDKEIILHYAKSTRSEADFLVVFKDWNALSAFSAAYFISVNSSDSGMGMLENEDRTYGSRGNLKGLITMPNIKVLSDPDSFNANIFSFAHELGHYWLAYFYDPLLMISNSSGHYNSCMVFGDGDIMTHGFFNFKRVSDTLFASPPPDNDPHRMKFSDFSLYVMGLLPEEEVAPIGIVKSGMDCVQNGKVENGAINVTGDFEQFTLSDFIKVYGARNPPYPNAKRNFTVQVALLVHRDSPLTQNDADTFKRYLDEAENYLPFAVSNKATFKFLKN
ncbi:MAG: hypothetical protein NUV53_00285 [Patescibacteria group bacterium]|nr:hypothetical protein [Patescibacteria group bacterium]